MRISQVGVLVPFVIVLGSAAAGAQVADSASAAVAGERDGTAAGRSASMSGVRWGSAAATFFGTPFVGGVIVLSRSGRDPSGVPGLVPAPRMPVASNADYARAYRDAYRAEYLPRRRHTMRSTMVVTSVVFVGLLAALSG